MGFLKIYLVTEVIHKILSRKFHQRSKTIINLIDDAWISEAKSRFDAYARGEIKGFSIDEVMNRINSR